MVKSKPMMHKAIVRISLAFMLNYKLSG